MEFFNDVDKIVTQWLWKIFFLSYIIIQLSSTTEIPKVIVSLISPSSSAHLLVCRKKWRDDGESPLNMSRSIKVTGGTVECGHKIAVSTRREASVDTPRHRFTGPWGDFYSNQDDGGIVDVTNGLPSPLELVRKVSCVPESHSVQVRGEGSWHRIQTLDLNLLLNSYTFLGKNVTKEVRRNRVWRLD